MKGLPSSNDFSSLDIKRKIMNVLALIITTFEFTGAIRTYFKSLKSRSQRQAKGIHEKTNQQTRRRQRMSNVR